MKNFLILIPLLLILTACLREVPRTPSTIQSVPRNTVEPAAFMLLPPEERFPAWDISLETLDGDTVTLSDQQGKWAILNFWATYCVPCRVEMPVLQAISETYADEVLVLGVNQRETPEQVEEFLGRLGVDFTILMNPDDTVLMSYAVINLPQTLLIDPEGQVAWRSFGAISEANFEAVLAQAL